MAEEAKQEKKETAAERNRKGNPWLQRVQARAAYNVKKRIRDQQEEAAFREAMANGQAYDLDVSLDSKKGSK